MPMPPFLQRLTPSNPPYQSVSSLPSLRIALHQPSVSSRLTGISFQYRHFLLLSITLFFFNPLCACLSSSSSSSSLQSALSIKWVCFVFALRFKWSGRRSIPAAITHDTVLYCTCVCRIRTIPVFVSSRTSFCLTIFLNRSTTSDTVFLFSLYGKTPLNPN